MKPAPLRHPQLLNPPSICPQCGTLQVSHPPGRCRGLLTTLYSARQIYSPDSGFWIGAFCVLEARPVKFHWGRAKKVKKVFLCKPTINQGFTGFPPP